MRYFTLIGLAGKKAIPLAMPDVEVHEQLALRKEILTAGGVVPKTKTKLDALLQFSSDGVKISRFGSKPAVNPKA